METITSYEKIREVMLDYEFPYRESSFETFHSHIKNNQSLTLQEKEYLINSYMHREKFRDEIRNARKKSDFITICTQCKGKRSSLKYWKLVEWVPFENFKNVQFLKNGGFGSIYTATWTDGWVIDWDDDNKKFLRSGHSKIALKLLFKSNNLNLALHNVMLSTQGFFGIQCYGITRFPDSEEFMLILDYMEYGSLTDFLECKEKKFTWKEIYFLLRQIFKELTDIKKGLRPPPIFGLHPDYEYIMKRCWDDEPSRRPEARGLFNYFDKKLNQMYKGEYVIQDLEFDFTSYLSDNHVSKILDFVDLPILKPQGSDNDRINDVGKYVQVKTDSLLIMKYTQSSLTDDDAALVYRGAILLKKKLYKLSENDLKKAIELGSTDPYCHCQLGALYAGLKCYDESLKELNLATDFQPCCMLDNIEKSEALYYRGVLYKMIGDFDKATIDFRQALQLNQDNELVKNEYNLNSEI
ncbi:24623_t:CDS:2 [Gigaspora margarita]|uniref:24623_t:CDS:1 n=1 Tax=Gigaspora margarita TaxID=4874 RepID=A0ABN7UK09_GIGMA|nr:24623_t:CDS:2 [Gigaspora margarita]